MNYITFGEAAWLSLMSRTCYDVRPENSGEIESKSTARTASTEFEGGPKMGPKGGCGPVGRAPLGHFLPGQVCLSRWLLPALLLHHHRGQGCLHLQLMRHLVQATAGTTCKKYRMQSISSLFIQCEIKILGISNIN